MITEALRRLPDTDKLFERPLALSDQMHACYLVLVDYNFAHPHMLPSRLSRAVLALYRTLRGEDEDAQIACLRRVVDEVQRETVIAEHEDVAEQIERARAVLAEHAV
jgi:hypothetical protein